MGGVGCLVRCHGVWLGSARRARMAASGRRCGGPGGRRAVVGGERGRMPRLASCQASALPRRRSGRGPGFPADHPGGSGTLVCVRHPGYGPLRNPSVTNSLGRAEDVAVPDGEARLRCSSFGVKSASRSPRWPPRLSSVRPTSSAEADAEDSGTVSTTRDPRFACSRRLLAVTSPECWLRPCGWTPPSRRRG